jgi:subtilisin-like proprotein convertase family protein
MPLLWSMVSLALAPAGAWAQVTNPEVEPNETKANATIAASGGTGMVSGDRLTGATSGSASTPGANSADTFRVKTAPAALGIYRHRLQISGGSSSGFSATLRGRSQLGSVINTTSDVAIQSSNTVVSGSLSTGSNQWYGFGKSEEVFYRITGTGATGTYFVTLNTTPVTPVVVDATILTGSITIKNGPSNPYDTDFWLYDANFNAIANAGNDQPGSLTRNLLPGTYYIAWTDWNLANDQPAAPDDNYRDGLVTDFANIAVNNATATYSNPDFFALQIQHSTGTNVVQLQKNEAFTIAWVKFTVSGQVNPSGIGSATPTESAQGSPVTLSVNVVPGTPAAAITGVVADLSSYGLTTLALAPTGPSVWSGTFNVPANAAPGLRSVPFTITDASARVGTGAIAHTVAPPIFAGLRISRVYAGGGLIASAPNADYVELFNASGAPRSLSGYTLQLAEPSGSIWRTIPLSGTIAANGYYLIQTEAPGNVGVPIASPDATTTGYAPTYTYGGKVALCATPSALSTSNPLPNPRIVDFLGYGTANAFQGAAAFNTAADPAFVNQRLCRGVTNSGNNAADFENASPNAPFNTASPINSGLSVVAATIQPAVVEQDAMLTLVARPRQCGSNAPVLGAAVTADLTALAGPAGVVMSDNGLNGDATANDGLYTARVRIPANASLAAGVITFNATLPGQIGVGSGTVTVIPPTYGACCTATGCALTSALACADAGGTWAGANTLCDQSIADFAAAAAFPITVPDGQSTGVTVSLTIPPGSGTVDRLVAEVTISHFWAGDLRATLSNGTTTVTLFDRVGRATVSSLGDDSFFTGTYLFSDDAAGNLWLGALAVDPSMTIPSGRYQPADAFTGALPGPSLAAFDGQPLEGTWTLFISDNDLGSPGNIQAFKLHNGRQSACATTCATDYNRDNFVNLDDLGDFITDYYTAPPIPGGIQPNAPTYPAQALGFGIPCPNAPDAPAPFSPDAYRQFGYRVGYSADASNACPLSPGQTFPNLDNLGDFITTYYAGGC